jgi:hypothetical protein
MRVGHGYWQHCVSIEHGRHTAVLQFWSGLTEALDASAIGTVPHGTAHLAPICLHSRRCTHAPSLEELHGGEEARPVGTWHSGSVSGPE